MKNYIVKIIDKSGIEWVYEGKVNGECIFTKRDDAVPSYVSMAEAQYIAEENVTKGEKYLIEKAI